VAEQEKYLYGPVPSRRLGLSLGVDIVPFKVCTLDCVYCQIGSTTEKTVERKEYVPIKAVLAELRQRVEHGLRADFVTMSGSGEPTLYSRLGELIEAIKNITDIAVAIVTNGTLLYRQDVRADCAKADVVLPSLDAADEPTFRRVNRPHADISAERLISGLCAFRDEYPGQIWLEVLLVEGVNTSDEQIARIKEAIERIRPDKVQLNTAVRPAADFGVRPVDVGKLEAIAAVLGDRCEVVGGFSPSGCGSLAESRVQDVLSMLKRRPCSLDDICSGLNIGRNEALKYVTDLRDRQVIHSELRDGVTFFKAVSQGGGGPEVGR
jgi:wyosine [tRNA(Phe)-imidazoG37] synthetase (radical SAM superfamily)